MNLDISSGGAWRGLLDVLILAVVLGVMWAIPERVFFDVLSVLALLYLAWRVYGWLVRRPKVAGGHHQSSEEP